MHEFVARSRTRLKAGALASAALMGIGLPIAAHGQEAVRTALPAPPQPSLQDISRELQQLRAEAAAAKAAEEARARRIDQLADELARATGTPVPPAPAVEAEQVQRLPD